eukprot:TRINITY_DN4257_c0_g2_i9.p3 TRINITY_DN4257_c0_g2~~TRINITY_DN4257_c0_g2_i9.p3  ORF type:complete len:101 (-),score=28.01 TRINITY_DN4257_c0_g2_i9:109-411(-)
MIIRKMLGDSKARMFCILFTLKLSTLLGYIVGTKLFSEVLVVQVVLMGFAAGMFIYMSVSDIVPEEMEGENVVLKYLVFAAGVVIMMASSLAEGEGHHHH